MQFLLPILQLITIGAKIFDKERSLYYINSALNLERKIQAIADTDFYNKDMEAKGRAERELGSEVHKLRLEFVSEGEKV